MCHFGIEPKHDKIETFQRQRQQQQRQQWESFPFVLLAALSIDGDTRGPFDFPYEPEAGKPSNRASLIERFNGLRRVRSASLVALSPMLSNWIV